VSFSSYAQRLVDGDDNGDEDVFVRDFTTDTTSLASVANHGGVGNDTSDFSSISADGTRVAFKSEATDLVGGLDTHGRLQAYVRDLAMEVTLPVSVSSDGGLAEFGVQYVGTYQPRLSADGHHVAFESYSDDLVPGVGFPSGVFVRDLDAGVTVAADLDVEGVREGAHRNLYGISGNGDRVVFRSTSPDLVTRWPVIEHDYDWDMYVHDIGSAVTVWASVAHGRTQPDKPVYYAAISDDGHWIAFSTTSSSFSPDDHNRGDDVYLRRLP
jgi:hypothetical protein